MIVYVSGKITGLPDLNKPAFASACRRLKEAGYSPVNPHDICQDIPADAPHHVFMERCLSVLPECDAIVVLPGSLDSAGTKIEHAFCKAHHIPLISIDWLETVRPYKALKILLSRELRRAV